MWPLIAAAAMTAADVGTQLYTDYKDREARQGAFDYLRSMKNASEGDYRRIEGDINSYYNRRGSLGSLQDAQDYASAIRGYNPDDYVYNRKQFGEGYNKTAQDYINPYYDQIIGDTAAAVQHSAAGAGLGRGSGAAASIADAVARKNDELYRTAMQDYRDDRDFEYQKYNDYVNAMQQALDTKRAATETKLGLQGNLAQDYYGAMDSRQADLMRARQDKLAANANYAVAMSGLY